MRILVVEDDKQLNEIYSEILREDGHEVDSAHDPHEALDAFHAHKPDAILLDWMLESISGEGVLYVLQERMEGVRVVICTASEDEIPDVIHGVKIDSILRKPWDLAEIPVALGIASEEDLLAAQKALNGMKR